LFAYEGARPFNSYGKAKHDLDAIVGSKVAPWTLHDLRRTAAMLMADNGVSNETVDRVLGHVIGGVSGTYNRANHIEAKRAAVERLAEVVVAIVKH
jgi:integrase